MSDRALIERFIEAWRTFDIDGLRAVVTDDVEWHLPPSAGRGPVRGAADVTAALGGGTARQVFDIDNLTRDVHDIIVDGDRAAISLTLTAPLLDGGHYRNEYCWVLHLRDGRIERLVEHADTLAGAKAFGRLG